MKYFRKACYIKLHASRFACAVTVRVIRRIHKNVGLQYRVYHAQVYFLFRPIWSMNIINFVLHKPWNSQQPNSFQSY